MTTTKPMRGRPRNDAGLKAGWQGRALTARRIVRGLTLSELADILDVAPSTLWDWEADRREPTREIVDRLAEVFGCQPFMFGRLPTDAASKVALGMQRRSKP